MKIKLLIFTIILLTAFNTLANDNKKVSGPFSDIEKIETLSADFIQINEIKDFGKDEYSGSMALIKGDSALWDYKKPFISWYIFSRDTIKHYDSTHNQLIIYKNDETISNVLLQLLIDVSIAKSKFEMATKGSTITLIPKENLGVKEIKITLNKGVISEMESNDSAGNNTKIIFKNVKVNKKINPKTFDKKVPIDAEIFEEGK